MTTPDAVTLPYMPPTDMLVKLECVRTGINSYKEYGTYTLMDGYPMTDGLVPLCGRPLVMVGSKTTKFGNSLWQMVGLTHTGSVLAFRVMAVFLQPYDMEKHEPMQRRVYDEWRARTIDGGARERLNALRVVLETIKHRRPTAERDRQAAGDAHDRGRDDAAASRPPVSELTPLGCR